jgi:hypothetical protein
MESLGNKGVKRSLHSDFVPNGRSWCRLRMRNSFLTFKGMPLVLICFLLSYPLPIYSQTRILSESIEYLMRLSSKSMPRVRPTYQVLADGVAAVSTVNGAYKIYVDCQRGLASSSINYLPQDQQVSLIRTLCSNFR